MAEFLTQMADVSRARCDAARRSVPEGQLHEQIASLPSPHPIRSNGFVLIAEIKRTSPAQGALADCGLNITELSQAYQRGGAAVISVLTEPTRFHGSLDDLLQASAVPIPIMRKDFLIDPYQVLEARAHGASGVLLIIKMLSDDLIKQMIALVHELRMFALLEAFDDADLERCPRVLPSAPSPHLLLGLNTRDLRDLSVSPSRLESLANRFPPGYRRIAESGLAESRQIERAVQLGYDGALVGTALMKSRDPVSLCRTMVHAGHQALRARTANEF